MNKKGKAKHIISLILLIIFLGGIIGGLGWATKGFKDKSFGNLMDIVDGYIKKKESNKKGKESEKKQENKFKLSHGVEVSDFANTLDYKYMTEKKESNALHMASLRSGENIENKNIYMSFRQWPEKAKVNTIQAKLVSKESGETTFKNGKSVTDYVELDKEEFSANEQLKISYKKCFDEYIDLVVKAGDKEYRVKIGCRGDEIDFDKYKLDYEFDPLNGDIPFDIISRIKADGYSFGTEDQIKQEDIDYSFKSLLVRSIDNPENFDNMLALFNKIDSSESLDSIFKKIAIYEDWKKWNNDKTDKNFQNLQKKLIKALANGYKAFSLKLPDEKESGKKSMEYWLKNIYETYYGKTFTEEQMKKIYYLNFCMGLTKVLPDSSTKDPIRKYTELLALKLGINPRKAVGFYLTGLNMSLTYKGKKHYVTSEPSKMKGVANSPLELTADKDNHIFG